MSKDTPQFEDTVESGHEEMASIFEEYENRSNFVGFFDLLYKIDQRLEPERYVEGAEYHD